MRYTKPSAPAKALYASSGKEKNALPSLPVSKLHGVIVLDDDDDGDNVVMSNDQTREDSPPLFVPEEERPKQKSGNARHPVEDVKSREKRPVMARSSTERTELDTDMNLSETELNAARIHTWLSESYEFVSKRRIRNLLQICDVDETNESMVSDLSKGIVEPDDSQFKPDDEMTESDSDSEPIAPARRQKRRAETPVS